MTSEQLEQFRQKLEEQRSLLNARIADAGARAREPIENASGDVGDLADEAVQDVLVDTALEVGGLRTRELEEIEEAILRIQAGEYGVCEACGRPIEIDRLEALPTARLCKEDARRTDIKKPPKL